MDHQDKNTVGNWTSRSIGKAWQHRFFYVLIRYAGLRVACFCMYFVVLWYILFYPPVHAKCRPYLSRRFPGRHRLLRRFIHEYRWITSLGKTLIDRAAFGILGPDRFQIEVAQSTTLQQLVDQGKGLILLNAHTGCWQIAFSALQFKRARVHIVMHRNPNDIDKHYFEHNSSEPPFEIIDPQGYLGGVLQMAAILQAGDVLGLMGDRIFGDPQNAITLDFLGHPASMPAAPYRLAAMRGSPIAILFSHRTGHCRYRIQMPAVINVPAALERDPQAWLPYAKEFVRHLTEFTKNHPFELYNFFNMWDVAPQTAAENS